MTNGEKIEKIFPNVEIIPNPYSPSVDIGIGGIMMMRVDRNWWNAEYKEPTTKNDLALIHTEGLNEEIRCTMCTNSMKSDRGCDGSCVVNKDMYKAVIDAIEKRIQPTTKNNLGVDCIDREQAINSVNMCSNSETILNLQQLPSVTPIRPKGRWISHGEHCRNLGVIPSGLGAYEWCSNCDCGIDVREWYKSCYNFCPNCGADMRGEEV